MRNLIAFIALLLCFQSWGQELAADSELSRLAPYIQALGKKQGELVTIL